MTDSSAPQPRNRPTFFWLSWIALLLVAVLALATVVIATRLHRHANERHAVLRGLEKFERLATAHSNRMWKGLTLLVADDKHAFFRVRGEEQTARGVMATELDRLRELDEQGESWNRRLGLPADPDLWNQLDASSAAFIGNVQGVFGQLNLSTDRVRQRLSRWDRHFPSLEDALEQVKAHNEATARRASMVASQAAVGAASVMLLVLGLGIWRWVRLRARRAKELYAERLATLATSEARFKALVQNGSDLILVAEPDGSLRYASPSCRSLLPNLDQSGAEQPTIEDLFGVDAVALTEARTTEIEIEATTASDPTCVLDVRATDLRELPEVRGIVINARDVTERKLLEDRMRYQALHDPLTDLPNRRKFKQSFDQRDRQADAAVLFIDLDGFKRVNDSYGHASGDSLLAETAVRIGTCLSERDVLARQGGDEFLVLLNDTRDPMETAERILRALEPPFALESNEVFVSASIGLVSIVEELDSDVAAQQADIAMYCAKQAGKARVVAFTEDMLGDAPERLQLDTDFRRALERDEFTVYYQPKVGFASGKIESLEALVRWEHPTRGVVGPDLFIPFAEETGLISELGRTILIQACHDAVRWQGQGVVVAVNLSPIQFRNPHLVDEVRDAIESSGLDPKFLELEITESAVLGDVAATIEVLDRLKELGVRLAIDDFGTGYSNLSHLKHYNVDVLKIDQSFVRGGNPGTEDLSDGAIVEAVIAMAKAFGLHVVAEGVETLQHATELEKLGADLGQGYYFSKPVVGLEIDELLANEPAATAS